MCVFKLYLGRILGTFDQCVDIAALSGPLLLYHHQPRYQVGSMLLATPDLGPPAPYIPTFYQECAPITPRANQEVSAWLGHHHSAQSVILLADCHFHNFSPLFSLRILACSSLLSTFTFSLYWSTYKQRATNCLLSYALLTQSTSSVPPPPQGRWSVCSFGWSSRLWCR